MTHSKAIENFKYVTGLVVGKFCPLHKGHEYVIETALKYCETVIVLSYTSMDMRGYESHIRKLWFDTLKVDHQRLKVHILDHLVNSNIKDDSPAENHRNFCANYLLNSLDTTVQAVFTSEDYGDGFANYLTNYFSTQLSTSIIVQHVLVDKERSTFNVSGTELRNAIKMGNHKLQLEMMRTEVYSTFIKKILFLGGESTGKTTIVNTLSDYYKVKPVLEFGRFMYDKRNGNLQYEDMLYIAESQIALENENALLLHVNQYLFCDTSPLTTMFYCLEMFGCVPTKLIDIVWDCDYRYDKIYLCAPDFPMVQDGTRKDEKFRQKGHEFYINHLECIGIEYTLLTGNLEQKIDKVLVDLNS